MASRPNHAAFNVNPFDVAVEKANKPEKEVKDIAVEQLEKIDMANTPYAAARVEDFASTSNKMHGAK